jgi:hypothetical protein
VNYAVRRGAEPLPVALRQIGTTGKFPLHRDRKSSANCGRPVPARGAVARRHERGTGCGGRKSVGAPFRRAGRTTFERTAKPCGPDAPTLAFKFRANVREAMVTTKPGHQGERGISRKTITQGMPGASAEPVCSCAHPLSIAHETAGAA